MRRYFAPGFFWVAAAGVVGAGGASGAACATSEPAVLEPGVDPGLPGVDAGAKPTPLPGNGSSGSSGAGAADAGGEEEEEPPPPPPPPKDAGTDAKPSVNPDAGGTDAGPTAPKPAPGEVLITEVMYNALKGSEPGAEWIEVKNLAASERSLSGLTLKDGAARTHVIGAGVTLAGGAYAVLVRNKAIATTTALVPAAAILYEYGKGLPDNAGVQLANGSSGAVALLNGAVTVANAPYGSWFSQSGGSSVQLKVLDPAQTSAESSWCLSLNPWATGADKGTPGAASDCL